MTKVQNPIIGRAKGSAGGMTFSKNSDQNVMRAKAFEVNNPKTAAQTTQRDFFKEVQSIVDGVSPEQLRSLFGDKPKKMSRRNALFKQVAAAYSVDGNTKSVDFSKLLAIGNGLSVKTPFFKNVGVDDLLPAALYRELFNLTPDQDANLILVLFEMNSQKIIILNTDFAWDGLDGAVSLRDFGFTSGTYCGYPTCSASGEYVYNRGFGSFIIKTRKEKVGH